MESVWKAERNLKRNMAINKKSGDCHNWKITPFYAKIKLESYFWYYKNNMAWFYFAQDNKWMEIRLGPD